MRGAKKVNTRLGMLLASLLWIPGAVRAADESAPASTQPGEEKPADPMSMEKTAAVAEQPAPVSAPVKEAPIQVGYDKGIFLRSADGLYELKIKFRTHGLYTFYSQDAGADKDRTNQSNFSISVARLTLGGTAFTPNLNFMFEAELGKGFVKLLDSYADYAFVPKVFQVRAGMWKRPFARQFIISSGKDEMVERSFVNGVFGEGYDIGLAFHNGYEKSPTVEWALGVFNGDNLNKYSADKPYFSGTGTVDPATGKVTIDNGTFTNVPTKFHPALVARIGYNLGGIDGYSEADLEGGPLRLAIAADTIVDFDYDGDNQSDVRGGLDWLLKVEGLSFSGALFIASGQKTPPAGGSTSFTDQEYKASGCFLQLGYLFAGKFQPVVRYSLASPDKQKTAQEIAAGFSVYFFKHNFKWQILGSALINQAAISLKSNGHDYVDGKVMTVLVFSL